MCHEAWSVALQDPTEQKITTVERFEELEVWQAARDVVNAVYKASSNGAFARDYALPCGIYDSGVIPRSERDQIRRAPWNKSQIAIPWGRGLGC